MPLTPIDPHKGSQQATQKPTEKIAKAPAKKMGWQPAPDEDPHSNIPMEAIHEVARNGLDAMSKQDMQYPLPQAEPLRSLRKKESEMPVQVHYSYESAQDKKDSHPTPAQFTFSEEDRFKSAIKPQSEKHYDPKKYPESGVHLQLPSHRVAKESLDGLDPVQVNGVSGYRLSRENVTDKNFGQHTLRAIDHVLRNGDGSMHIKDAYEKVKGFSAQQVERAFTKDVPVPPVRPEASADKTVRVGNFEVPAPGQRIGPTQDGRNR